MASADQMLPDDARLYAFRDYRSVLPLPQWPDLKEWKRQRTRIRQHLLLCAGLNASTAAFAARGRVIRTFAHAGLTVENLCIETLPGVYVIGNLYRPARPAGRLPLVLHPHGHAMHARTVPLDLYSVPHRAMNHALAGMAAFAYSMIGYDVDAAQLEHGTLLRGPEKQVCNVLGLSMFGLQLNNSIKALDYLCSRPDIDPGRIGCTGESGGGTQTYFLAAVDQRVKAAAPAVMLSGHFQGGCVCENAPLLHLRYSNLHYAALIAPRPLLLLGCTGDWTHHVREREYPCLRALYAQYGAEEAIDWFYQDEQHNYNRPARERVYGFMAQWLAGGQPGQSLPEADTPPPPTEALRVFPAAAPPYRRVVRTTDEAIAAWRRLHAEPASPAEVADVLDLELPAAEDILVRSQTPRHAYRRQRDRLHLINYGRFSHSSSLQCRFLPPERGGAAFLVVRSWPDAAAWRQFADAPPTPVRRLLDAGGGLLVPLLFGQERVSPVDAWRQVRQDSYLATTYNRTDAMHQADDIVTTMRLAQVEMGIAPSRLAIVADGQMGLVALAAWAFLRSQMRLGPLAVDMGGVDLEDPAVWVERAYFPLLAGAGGVRALAGLANNGQGLVTGVPAACRRLLPRWLRVRAASAGLEALLADADRLLRG